jgi:acetyl-CoA carboxylase carboxyltransferase component
VSQYHATTCKLQQADAADAFLTHPSRIKLAFREQLALEREKALLGGGQKRVDKQHARGSLTARERLELLFDKDTFQELDQLKAHRCTEFGMDDESKQFPGDGIVTGHGLVNGRVVYAFSQGMDKTVVCKTDRNYLCLTFCSFFS